MKFIAVLFILGGSYYTLTYAKSLWQDEGNKAGAAGAALLAVLGILAPLLIFLSKN